MKQNVKFKKIRGQNTWIANDDKDFYVIRENADGTFTSWDTSGMDGYSKEMTWKSLNKAKKFFESA